MSKGSKYRNKKKGQATPVAKKRLDEPVFNYFCVCHGEKAKKKPLVVDHDTQFSDRNKPEHSLGTWNCAITGRKTKVTRSRAKSEEPVEQAA